MSKRGGSRPGAGRPQKLTALQRFLVGAWCEASSVQSIKTATRIKMGAAIVRRAGNIQELYTELNSDVIFSPGKFNYRPALLRAANGATESVEHETAEIGAEARMEIVDRLANKSRLVTVSAARGRLRKEILSEVRQQVCDELGARISIHLVEICWKEHRRLIRRFNANSEKYLIY
jgi:hypothetical protein